MPHTKAFDDSTIATEMLILSLPNDSFDRVPKHLIPSQVPQKYLLEARCLSAERHLRRCTKTSDTTTNATEMPTLSALVLSGSVNWGVY
jgi:hypothetical protein